MAVVTNALLLFSALAFLTVGICQETKLTDDEAILAYENSILEYLVDGQYDALEDQFQEVQDRSAQLQDGNCKIWAYFRAFDLSDAIKHKTLDDIQSLVR